MPKGTSDTPMAKTVFIDRDGVINRDSPDYIKSVDEFEFLPGSLDALRDLTRHQYDIFLITNQSVIGRNMVTPKGLRLIFQAMQQGVENHGGTIKDIFFCPHVPDDQCLCRKPKPGMIYSARDKYDIDLHHATMIGDSTKDIRCAHNAGVGRTVLVLTGNGPKTLNELQGTADQPDFVALDLFDAVQWIISQDLNRDTHD